MDNKSYALKENEIRDRLNDFIKRKGYSRRRVAKECGFSITYLSTLSGDIPAEKLSKILEVFPDLNVEWLKTGKGVSEKGAGLPKKFESVENNGYTIMNRVASVLDYYKISVPEFEKEHELPKGAYEYALPSEDLPLVMSWVYSVCEAFPMVSYDWLLTGRRFMLKSKHEIPLISNLQTCSGECSDLILCASKFFDGEFLYQSFDRDMSPKIKVGDFLICKKAYDRITDFGASDLQKKMLWESRATYLILFKGGQARVKDVIVEDSGELLLYGIGPTGESVLAHSTTVDSSDIDKAFKVTGIIRQNLD